MGQYLMTALQYLYHILKSISCFVQENHHMKQEICSFFKESFIVRIVCCNNMLNRLLYVTQLIIARKISPKFSI